MSTPALGTPEYTNYLIDQGKTLGLDLEQYRVPAASAPTSSTQVTSTSAFNSPSLPPPTGDTTKASAFVAGTDQELSTMEALLQKEFDQRMEIEKQRQASESKWTKLLQSSVPNQTQIREDVWDSTGIVPKEYFAQQRALSAEINALNLEYNKTKTAMQSEVLQANDRLATTGNISREQYAIEKRYFPTLTRMSAEVNSKAAYQSALKGNFAEARDFVSQAVEDAVATKKYQYDLFKTMFERESDKFDRLDSIYKDAFSGGMELAKTSYEQTLREKNAIGDMMIDPALRGAGINITDTYEEALAKAQAVAGPNYVSSQNLIHGDSSSSGTTASTGFASSKVEAEVRGEVADYLPQIRADAITKEDAYSDLRVLFSPSEVSDATLKSLLGIAEVQAPTAQTTTSTPTASSPRQTADSSLFGSRVGNFMDKVIDLVYGTN